MIFTLTSSAIPPNARVAGFRGSERISQPYVFDVYFTAEPLVPGLPLQFDLADAIYAKATLTVQLGDAESFSFSGVFASLRLVRASEVTALYHARLVPQLWQLLLTKHSRIWTKRSIVDVIEEVLDEGSIDYELRLQGAYGQEEMITQYKESNLAFIQRWMDREGMYYFFEQREGADVLVITDHRGAHASLRTSPVKYWPQSGADGSVNQAFDNFAAGFNALPASVKIIDYDYGRPLLDVSSTVSVDQNAVGEIAEYGSRLFDPGEAQRLAQVRAEEHLVTKTVFEITGAATSLSAGFLFSLEEHPHPQYNTDYLATSVEHYGYDAQLGPTWGSLIEKKYDEVYRVELKAISAGTQFRNGQRTPWPRIDGYENAIVDGPASSLYAQIDDQGRYNLKFKFDEGSLHDGKATTFVRMAQPHGGSQEGFHFPLRKGVEVICSFLGGDPDRPVITGVVHNMLNQSVVTQSNHTQNVIRSGSLNHLVMEDTAGQMWIEAYCPIFSSMLFLGFGDWNFELTTQGKGKIHTTLNFYLEVDQHWEAVVKNFVDWKFHNTAKWWNALDVTFDFDATMTWTNQGTFLLDIEGATTFDINNTWLCHVVGDITNNFDASVNSTILGNVWTEITGSHSLINKAYHLHHTHAHEDYKVGAGQTINIDAGGQTITVHGGQTMTVNGDQTLTINTDKTETISGNYALNIAGNLTSVIGGNEDSIKVGSKSKITTGNDYGGHMGMKFTFNAGLFLELALAAKISVTAASIGITGFSLGITGISMGVTGVDYKNKGGLKVQLGALCTDIKALIMKI